jgi:hypothetical protein
MLGLVITLERTTTLFPPNVINPKKWLRRDDWIMPSINRSGFVVMIRLCP